MNHPYLQALAPAAEALTTGDTERALAQAQALCQETQRLGTPAERVAHRFATYLCHRITGKADSGGNLYVSTQGPNDMLAAFQVLLRHTPFVRFGHLAANRAISAALAGAPQAHLIDFGIGSGIQWPVLLHHLAFEGTRRLRLDGVDIPAAGADPGSALRQVGAMLAAEAAQTSIQLEYVAHPTRIEELDFAALGVAPDEPLAVNAAFALHHIPPAGVASSADSSREAILARIHALGPQVMTLVEPDVEHNALPLVDRLRESFTHYFAVYEALELLLPHAPRERATIEQEFFGREIQNVVIGEGLERVERHARYASWRALMAQAGFRQIPLTATDADALTIALGAFPSAITVTAAEDALRLRWQGTPLVAASAWTS